MAREEIDTVKEYLNRNSDLIGQDYGKNNYLGIIVKGDMGGPKFSE